MTEMFWENTSFLVCCVTVLVHHLPQSLVIEPKLLKSVRHKEFKNTKITAKDIYI